MDKTSHVAYPASDRSYLSHIKKEIHSLALRLGFDEKRVGETDILVAELTSNLVKHAENGIVLVNQIEEHQEPGIEIIGIDTGPGITDISRMLKDGMSTTNTLGQGLGAIKRLSDLFQVYSQRDWGTIMLIRKFRNELTAFKKPPKTDVRAVIVPKRGETRCGDMFYTKTIENYQSFFLGDGLGHGEEAWKAVSKAGEAFHSSSATDPVELIRVINEHVKKTRGLVGTVATLNLDTRKWKVCGVGNIMTRINSSSILKQHVSYNGIIGLNVPNTLSSMELDAENGQYLFMCSDGIKSRWDLVRHPSILKYDPAITSATIFKDYNRNTDDVSCVTCKVNL